jgi:hypothetical protein
VVTRGSQGFFPNDKLFVVRDENEGRKLSEEQALAFHHTVLAQLLFMDSWATRARRDIQMAVAFLTTRVKSPDEDDWGWGKLKRVLKYLNGNKVSEVETDNR